MDHNYKSVINDGDYFVVDDYQGKTELLDLVEKELISAVSELADNETAALVKRDGIAQMHTHVHPDIIPDLQSLVDSRIKSHMLRLTRSFGIEKLGLPDNFYLDLKVIVRVKFPFAIAKKSSVSYMDYSKAQGRTQFSVPPELTYGYHNDLPFAAWAHGPHYDSWFGHSFDGINLWWGIDGVTKDTGMTFYPEFVGSDALEVIEEPPYLEREVPLTKPTFFDLKPGDVIVFNSDTLHGTRVNQADLTRISLSTRINPAVPRFSEEQFRHVQYWVKSNELEDALSAAMPTGEQSHRKDSKFNIKDNPYIYLAKKQDTGDPQFGNTCSKRPDLSLRRVTVNDKFGKGDSVKVCPVDSLPIDQKLLVQFEDGRNIVIANIDGQLYAMSSICPHLGYNLAAGGHDNDRLYCNGHGLAFSWRDGKSECAGFRTRTYQVNAVNGEIVLKNAIARMTAEAAE